MKHRRCILKCISIFFILFGFVTLDAEDDSRSTLNAFYRFKGPFTFEGKQFSLIPNKSFQFMIPYTLHFSRHYQTRDFQTATRICKELNGILPDLKTMKTLQVSKNMYAIYYEERGTGIYGKGDSFFLTRDLDEKGRLILFHMKTGSTSTYFEPNSSVGQFRCVLPKPFVEESKKIDK